MGAGARYVTELVEACERYADGPAVGAGPVLLTYADVLAWAYRLAGALEELGVRRAAGLACVTAGNPHEALLVRLAAHVLGARLTQVSVGPAHPRSGLPPAGLRARPGGPRHPGAAGRGPAGHPGGAAGAGPPPARRGRCRCGRARRTWPG
ncbi:hypothetical protein ACFSNO_20670 [Streptomyces cirratus]